MRSSSRPTRVEATWSERYDATASSRPLRVASPQPTIPSEVVILSVTKLRPGLVMMTSTSSMVMSGSSLCGVRPIDGRTPGVCWWGWSHGGARIGEIASRPLRRPDGGDESGCREDPHQDHDGHDAPGGRRDPG